MIIWFGVANVVMYQVLNKNAKKMYEAIYSIRIVWQKESKPRKLDIVQEISLHSPNLRLNKQTVTQYRLENAWSL